MKFLTITLALLFCNLAFSQNREKYGELVKQAWSYYEAKDYSKSAETYELAFDELNRKAYPNDRYNAACSYALSEEVDSAFYHLFRLAESSSKYKNFNHISTDADLEILRKDARWNKLLVIVKANKEECEKNFDHALVRELEGIYASDQGLRHKIDEIEEKHGRKSEEMKAHWKKIQEADSINLIAVKKILDARGWLGADVIGAQGNSTLFLVIQHADIETQIMYLPMMREAVKNKKARGSSLAMLEDRVAMRQGNPQIYGSQISRDPETGEHYVAELIDPENVNTRRASVGLPPIESYVQHWGLTWDVEKHKKRFETRPDTE
jgi:hypothetical protein